MQNILISLFSLTLLTGCGILPMWVSMTHTVADVILHDRTGKTSSELVLSEVTEKDCKFIRFIDTNMICMIKKKTKCTLINLINYFINGS